MLLADKATFPRDKPCGGGMTLRAVRQCPVDPTPVVEEWIDAVELRFRYRAAVVRTTREPVVWMTQRRRLDAFLLDAAREKGVEVREGVAGRDRAGEHGRARLGRARRRRRDRRGRRRQRDHREGGRARRRDRLRRRLRGERQVPDRCRRSATRAGSCSSWPTSRAGMPGCSPRATTRTSASAAGRARGRSCASTCGAPARRTGSTPDALDEPARPPAAAAAARHADRRRARAARRRRRRADRPGLGRRDVRVLRLLAARRRGDPRPARRARADARAVRGGGRRRARRRSTARRGSSSRRSTAGRARPGRSRARSSSGSASAA